MKRRIPFILAAAVGLALAGCNNDDRTGDETTSAPGTAAPYGDTAGAGAADQAAMNDPAAADALAGNAAERGTLGMAEGGAGAMSQAAALAAVMAVDEHEVAAAEQADDRDLDDAVEEYANQLENDHRRNLAATRALLDTTGGSAGADTPELDAMRQKHRTERERLAGLEDDAEYQRAWLEAMVTDHTAALEMLDSQLIPAATDEPVREHLQKTRQSIAAHLETAQRLRDDAGTANR